MLCDTLKKLPCVCVCVCVCVFVCVFTFSLVHVPPRLNWANSERGFCPFHAGIIPQAPVQIILHVCKYDSSAATWLGYQLPLQMSKCVCVYVCVCVCACVCVCLLCRAAMLHVTAASCWVAEAPLFSRLAAGFCLGAALPVAAHWAQLETSGAAEAGCHCIFTLRDAAGYCGGYFFLNEVPPFLCCVVS